MLAIKSLAQYWDDDENTILKLALEDGSVRLYHIPKHLQLSMNYQIRKIREKIKPKRNQSDAVAIDEYHKYMPPLTEAECLFLKECLVVAVKLEGMANAIAITFKKEDGLEEEFYIHQAIEGLLTLELEEVEEDAEEEEVVWRF